MDSLFRKMLTLDLHCSKNVVDTEKELLDWMDSNKSDHHHTELGYSARLPRYRTTTGRSLEKQLSRLRRHYYRRLADVATLEQLIQVKETELQSQCTHNWEKDGGYSHRSHYTCTLCNKYR